MKFQSIIASALSIACSFCALTSLADHTASEADLGKEIDVGGTLTVSSTIDLQGKSVTYLGVTAFAGAGTFTDSSSGQPSTLTIEVAKGKTITNGGGDTIKIGFEGNLQFVKTGEGMLYNGGSKRTHTYTGGTVVKEGYLGTKKTGNDFASFGNPVNVLVESAGEFAGNSCYGFTTAHTITLDGGTWSVGGKNSDTKHTFKPSVSLTANSTFKVDKGIPVGCAIDLGGNELTINKTTSTETCYWYPSTIDNGTIKLLKGRLDLIQPAGSSTASLTLDAGTKIVGDFVYSVKDFVIDSTASVEGPVHVYGTYKPATVDAYMPMMQDGSKLDLSDFSDEMEIDASHFGSGEVTVYVGSRSLTDNETIIKWAGAPADTTFVLEGDNVTKKYEATATGLVYNPASDTVDKAVWTGAGVDPADYMAADNWACYSSDGTSLPEKVPETTMTVTFTGDVSKVSMTANFPFAGVNFEDAKLGSNADWSTFELAKISNSSIIDLAGKSLTISGEGTSTSAATFTDTIGGGVLTFQVDEGKVFDNETLNFTDKLQLAKTGTGIFIATKDDQTYSGGTVINAGVLKSGMQDLADKLPFGSGKIAVESGAYLDPAGGINWTGLVIALNGGAISNSVASIGRGSSVTSKVANPFDPTIELNKKSTLMTDKAFNFQGEIVSENQELDIEIYGGNTLLWNPKSATNLCVNVTKGGWFQVWSKNPVSYATQTGFTLMMTGGALDLCQKASSGNLYPATMDVENYFAGYTEDFNKDAGTLNVHGTFTPAGLVDDGDFFFGCTLLDGAIIDLSERSAAWVNESAFTVGPKAVTFADGATITIALGEREAKIGEVLVNWDEGKPTNLDSLEFLVTGENIEEGATLVRDDAAGTISLASADTTVATAEWNGDAGVSDFTDPKNWICRNAAGKKITDGDPLPTADTVVKMPYEVLSTTQFPVENQLVCKEIKFIGEIPESLTLETNTDWRGLGAIDFPCAIDLNGFNLFLTLKNGTSAKELSVTGEGELHATVLEDATYTNTSVVFNGELSFVKEGVGTFVASVTNQTYTGKTKVVGGVLASGIVDLKKATPFGENKAITVEKNGALDPRGSYNWTTNFVITLSGGSISNTVENTGLTGKAAINSSLATPFDPTIVLSQESIIATTTDFNLQGAVEANENVLDLSIALSQHFLWHPKTATNLYLKVVKGGFFRTMRDPIDPKATEGMTLDLNAAASIRTDSTHVGGLDVENYIARYSDSNSNEGTAPLNVHGTFTPAAEKNNKEYFYGCTMMDGSTIDLSSKSSVWATTSSSSSASGARNTISFADGAKVTIDLHERTLKNGEQIVSWTEETKPENWGEFTLVLDAQSRASGYMLVKKDDGIYVEHQGLLLLLK